MLGGQYDNLTMVDTLVDPSELFDSCSESGLLGAPPSLIFLLFLGLPFSFGAVAGLLSQCIVY